MYQWALRGTSISALTHYQFLLSVRSFLTSKVALVSYPRPFKLTVVISRQTSPWLGKASRCSQIPHTSSKEEIVIEQCYRTHSEWNCKGNKNVNRCETSSEIRINWNWKQRQEKSYRDEHKHLVDEKSECGYHGTFCGKRLSGIWGRRVHSGKP